MKVNFDSDNDVLYLRFSGEEIAESEEQRPGVIFDYDTRGYIVGMEFLEASTKINHPAALVHEVE
ncbi:MAG: DUF2283 domain-containing protein [Balneolaceae bacterium]|nr:DUF2283 domain-containing protein [Balneolaceae bacterium]